MVTVNSHVGHWLAFDAVLFSFFLFAELSPEGVIQGCSEHFLSRPQDFGILPFLDSVVRVQSFLGSMGVEPRT